MNPIQPPSPATPEAEGAETLEHVHITDKQACVTGDPADLPDSVPDDDPRRHNCDAMGCPTLDHVLYRLPFTDHRQPIDVKVLARQLAESIDFTAGPVQARQLFEKTLASPAAVSGDKQEKATHARWCNASYGNTRMSEDGESEFQRPCNCGGRWNA